MPPVVRISGAVLVGNTRFRTQQKDKGSLKKPSKSHHRYIKAEFDTAFRASARDRNVVAGKQLQYGVITDIFSLNMGRGEPEWSFIRANWFQPLALKVDELTHNVVVENRFGWWNTNEKLMLAENIKAQVLVVRLPPRRAFDFPRSVILDSTPLYPPATLGGVPRLAMATPVLPL